MSVSRGGLPPIPAFPLTLSGRGICPLCLDEIEVWPPEVRVNHWIEEHHANWPTPTQTSTAIKVARGGERPIPPKPSGLPPES